MPREPTSNEAGLLGNARRRQWVAPTGQSFRLELTAGIVQLMQGIQQEEFDKFAVSCRDHFVLVRNHDATPFRVTFGGLAADVVPTAKYWVRQPDISNIDAAA